MPDATTAPPEPVRTAHRHATYPADTRVMVGNVYGPNTLGEHMTAVAAEYDPETNSTRVGFDFARQEDFAR